MVVILIGGVGVVSSNPTGGNFLKPSMSLLYRNIRYVLKTKDPTVVMCVSQIVSFEGTND